MVLGAIRRLFGWGQQTEGETRGGLIEGPAELNSREVWGWLGWENSGAGVVVNSRTALGYPPFWRGVTMLCNDFAKVPLNTFRRQGEGKQRDTSHPAYHLLKYQPNPTLDSFQFRRAMLLHALIHRGGYAFIDRDQNARPLGLYLLDPNSTWPVWENGRLLYAHDIRYGNGDQLSQRKLLPSDVFHLRGLAHDGVNSYSAVDLCREGLGLGMASQAYSARYFANDGSPGVVLEFPSVLTAETVATLRETWGKRHQGVDNAHRMAVLDRGGKLSTINPRAKDAQLLETMKFSARLVANVLGIPSSRLDDEAHRTFGSLEMDELAYLSSSLDPWFVAWESEARNKLLTEQQKRDDSHLVEFERAALIRTNIADKNSAYESAIRAGWLTKDEVRAKENLAPLPQEQPQTGSDGANTITPVTPDADVAKTALNGAQVTSVADLLKLVAAGQMPAGSAAAIIKASFPEWTDAQVAAIVSPLEGFEAKVPDTAVPAAVDGAQRASVAEAISRSATRLMHKSEAHTRGERAKRFQDFIDRVEAEDGAAVREAIRPHVSAWAALHGGDAGVMVELLAVGLFRDVRAALQQAYDTAQPSEFEQSVTRALRPIVDGAASRVAEVLHAGE